MKYLYALLLFIPLSFVLEFAGAGHTWVFLSSAASLIPLAALLGRATDQVTEHTGARTGGLLNATFGNAAELIITIVAIQNGLLELVKASISGSIIGNALLVLGASLLVGGLKNGRQRFDAHIASISATTMTLSVVALVIPAIFSIGPNRIGDDAIENVSIGVSVILLILYGLFVLYTIFLQPSSALAGDGSREHKPEHSLWYAIGFLFLSTGGVVAMSELLVRNVEPVVESWGITELFLGVVLVPIIGNVAEHFVGVQAAHRNQMDLSLGISIGSSIQMALFVAPVLVFVSLLFGHRLTLVFNEYELASLVGAIGLATLISMDGESNWMEGVQLLAVYLIVALGFFYLS
jgi:Ca2+:H+ antiporter